MYVPYMSEMMRAAYRVRHFLILCLYFLAAGFNHYQRRKKRLLKRKKALELEALEDQQKESSNPDQ